MFGRTRRAELTSSDWVTIEQMIRHRVALVSSRETAEVVAGLFTPEIVRDLTDRVLGKLYNESELQDVLRALARDEGENAAKTYIARVLGWRLELTIGEAISGPLERVVPDRPPTGDEPSAEELRDLHPPNYR